MKYVEKIVTLLEEMLGVDTELITLQSDLVDDLGAESIDFIDICYQFEKMFQLPKVLLSEIYPDGYSSMEYSEENIELLQEKYPYLRENMIDKMKEVKSLKPMRTVQCLVEFIKWRTENAK